MDIHMYVEIKNKKSGEYDAIQPVVIRRDYHTNERVEVKPSFFEGRNSELFNILRGEEDYFKPHYDVLPDMSAEITEKYNKAFVEEEHTGYFDYRWITLAELYIALLETPKVKDYDEIWEDEPIYKDNPLKWIFEKAIFYVEDLYGEYYWKNVMTDVRIIYWFDN